MNFKTTYILFGVLVIVLGAFAFALWYNPNNSTTKSSYVLPALREGQDKSKSEAFKTDDITKVEIANSKRQQTFVLERNPDTKRWSITSPRPAPADNFAVEGLLQQLGSAVKEDKADESANLADWGLDPAQIELTITKKDKVIKLKLGKTNSSGDIYALDPYNPKSPMVVKENLLSDALKSLDEFRDGELLASSPGNLQAITLTDGKETVGWKKDSGDRWVYTEPKGYGEAASGFETPAPTGPGVVKAPTSIETVKTDVANLKVERTGAGTAFIDGVTDFGKYHLDPKDKILQIEATVLVDAGKDENGQSKTKPVSRTLLIGVGEKVGDKYYARLKGEDTVVQVSAKDVDALRELLVNKEALRDRNLVQMIGQPSAIDIKNNYPGVIQLRRSADKPDPHEPGSGGFWTLWRGDIGDPVDPLFISQEQSLTKLLLQKNLIDGFDNRKIDDPVHGFDSNSPVVQLWNDEDGVKSDEDKSKKPELKSKDPTYRLTFGNTFRARDKDLVYVKRESKHKDGTYDASVVEVPQLVLDMVKKGPLDYLSRALPRFTVSVGWEGVTKLLIQRGDKTVEVARENDTAPWKIVQPKEQAGRQADKTAIEDVLGKMNRLEAMRLVVEKADDAELSNYGLKPPQAKVEITTMSKDSKPTTYTYDFGKEPRAGSGEVYARQSQRSVIFTVPKPVEDLLPTELLDPVVFTFNVDKVQKVTLAGWQDVVGELKTLEFEKKDNKWEITKGLPKDKFDADKFTRLLDALHECRALRFDAFNPKPEALAKYKFAPEKGGLEMTLTVEGDDKSPIKLTIGGLDDKGGGYYAMSNRSAEKDVFVLPKIIFEGPKSKPTYFTKE